MLKQRIVTAVVLLLILAWVIYQGSKELFSLFTGIIVLIASWEWAGLSGCTTYNSRLLYSIVVTAIMFIANHLVPVSDDIGIYLVGTTWWIVAMLMVVLCQSGKQVIPKKIIAKNIIGIFVLLPASLSLIRLYNSPDGLYYIVLLFTVIWIADSTAYFIGKNWGKRRLADLISPGKSWEGLIGGVIVATIPAFVFIYLRSISDIEAIFLILLCLITVVSSVFGDLFESMIKREANEKDSSRLLPGHGGVLDRIDSLTAAVPVFALGLWVIEYR